MLLLCFSHYNSLTCFFLLGIFSRPLLAALLSLPHKSVFVYIGSHQSVREDTTS